MQPEVSDLRHDGRADEIAAAPEPARAKWRELVAGGLYRSGALRLAQRLSHSYELSSDGGRRLPRLRKVTSSKFVILCYHRIGTAGIPLFNGLPPEVFEAQMRYLRQRHRVISLGELCCALKEPQSIGQAVAITFDDGYRDLYTHAFPILRKYQLPATIFLTAGCVETGEVPWHDRVFLALKLFPSEEIELVLDRPRRFWLPTPEARLEAAAGIVRQLRRLPDEHRQECCAQIEKQVRLPEGELSGRMLTWEHVREMQQAGICFGSHTVTHRVMSQLAPSEMERELLRSKQIIEQRLQSAIRDFAYPFGQPTDCGNIDVAVLGRCGYRSAATTVWGINRPATNPYGLRRVQVGEEHQLAMFAFKLNELFFRAEEEVSAAESVVFASEAEETLQDSRPLAR